MADMKDIFYNPEAKSVEQAAPGTDENITFLEWKFDEASQKVPAEVRNAVFAKFREARKVLNRARGEVARTLDAARKLAKSQGIEL